ncbi:MAG: PAS-domain containing protein, partial [Candidatus Nomurabacteria bacterium]|nr:PAS-domain containing protein [Candidatus Nomurabacteria bacterium]
MGFFNKKQVSSTPKKISTTVLTSNISPELVVNSISDGVVAIDGQGNIQLINQPAITLTGFSSIVDALGLNFGTVIALFDKRGDEVNDSNNPILASIKSGSLFSSRAFELKSQSDGRKTPISLTIAPITGGGVVVSFKNIEREIEEENEQMEFISTASHEMRTPIASIEGYLSLAVNPATATIDQRAREYLTKAVEVSKHLGKLFQDLLDTTRLSENRLKANPVPVEITELVKSISQELIPQISEKRLSLSFNGIYLVGRSVNEGPKEARRIARVFYARVDVDFVREILSNLIENAIKYTQNGEIEIIVTGDSDSVVISVKDSGIGISKEDLDHIFQKFYRADSSDTRIINGTGLGLYISKQRAEELGGNLYAESELGRGSIFYLKLPRLSDEDFAREKAVLSNTISDADLVVPQAEISPPTANRQTTSPITPPPVSPTVSPPTPPATPPAAPSVTPPPTPPAI